MTKNHISHRRRKIQNFFTLMRIFIFTLSIAVVLVGSAAAFYVHAQTETTVLPDGTEVQTAAQVSPPVKPSISRAEAVFASKTDSQLQWEYVVRRLDDIAKTVSKCTK